MEITDPNLNTLADSCISANLFFVSQQNDSITFAFSYSQLTYSSTFQVNSEQTSHQQEGKYTLTHSFAIKT